MCVAVPGKILSIGDHDVAVVDFGGSTREISLSLLESPAVGEYVIVHAGFAMHKIDENEAKETIELMQQVINETDFD
jgi:hydrogenase expression/formation protein HypC